VIVRRIGTRLVSIVARCFVPSVAHDRKPARHAEVHDQVFTSRQFRDEVFGTSVEPDDLLTDKPFAKPLRQWKPEIRPAHLKRRDVTADKNWREATPYRLNFWKFRHFVGPDVDAKMSRR